MYHSLLSIVSEQFSIFVVKILKLTMSQNEKSKTKHQQKIDYGYKLSLLLGCNGLGVIKARTRYSRTVLRISDIFEH